MARTARSRERDLSFSSSGQVIRRLGSYSGTINGTVTEGPRLTGYQKTDDSFGVPWIDTTFTSVKGRSRISYASGQRNQAGLYYTAEGLPLSATACDRVLKPWVHYPKTPISAGTLAAMARANANPNRPDIDLPVFFVELRELPGLVRQAGRLAIARSPVANVRSSAEVNLATQFGVMPFFGDLAKLLGFAESVAKREDYLRALSKDDSHRIKRRLTSESWSIGPDDVIPFHSWIQTDPNMKIRFSGVATRNYWYTARAKLSTAIPARELRSNAVRATLGLTGPSIKQVWELVPWSWLIDWFTNTGVLLAAYRGGIPWQFSGLNVMYQTTYTLEGTFVNRQPHISCEPNNTTGKAVTKHRIQPSGWTLPELRIPYLSSGQLSILASLSVVKTR